jgi:hypothetical protein
MGALQNLLSQATTTLLSERPRMPVFSQLSCDLVLSNLSNLRASIPANDRFNANTARIVAASLYSLFNGGLLMSGQTVDLGQLQLQHEPPQGPFEEIRSNWTLYNTCCEPLGAIMESARTQS